MIIYKVGEKFDFPKKRICTSCKSELGVALSDVISVSKKFKSFRHGDYEQTFRSFACPVCKTTQQLN